MKRFVGTKELLARPMTRGEYNSYRNWDMPADEDANEPGMLIEYIGNDDNSNDPRHVGYITWSPKKVFDRSYRETQAGCVRFGLAIESMKMGLRVARMGWNGKGMYLYYVPANRYPPTTVPGQQLADLQADGLVPYRDYIAMKTVDGEVVPWLASQTDMLSEDWLVYAN